MAKWVELGARNGDFEGAPMWVNTDEIAYFYGVENDENPYDTTIGRTSLMFTNGSCVTVSVPVCVALQRILGV